jgi:hypothetical protein
MDDDELVYTTEVKRDALLIMLVEEYGRVHAPRHGRDPVSNERLENLIHTLHAAEVHHEAAWNLSARRHRARLEMLHEQPPAQ